MSDLEILLIKTFEIRLQKLDCIKLQQYENAAKFRDTERQMEESIYDILCKGNSVEKKVSFEYSIFELVISEYCIEEYGFNYMFDNSLIRFKRQIKLKNLGI